MFPSTAICLRFQSGVGNTPLFPEKTAYFGGYGFYLDQVHAAYLHMRGQDALAWSHLPDVEMVQANVVKLPRDLVGNAIEVNSRRSRFEKRVQGLPCD